MRLAQIEDAVNNSVVVIDRMLNNVNDDITRTMAYLSTERNNLRTLSMAINSGDLFGRSLANRQFEKAPGANITPEGNYTLQCTRSTSSSPAMTTAAVMTDPAIAVRPRRRPFIPAPSG